LYDLVAHIDKYNQTEAGDDAIDELDGRLYTLAPTQFFESINQQIELAKKTKYDRRRI
jgi:hypothetical protein